MCAVSWVLFLVAPACVGQGAGGPAELAKGFVHPPASSRPWVYWFPLDGNITSNGITLDLEAMQRVGIGGVLYMETEQGTPKGPAKFGGPQWRALFKHACVEANRLGLEVNMNNDAGWCGSGGPWITPALAMQKVVWTETTVEGPRRFDGALPRPEPVSNFYRDIAVLAFPTPPGNARIENIKGKAVFAPLQVSLAAPATWTGVPAANTIARQRVVDLTERLHEDGRLAWDVPQGQWTLLRFGHTPTGQNNLPAPSDGRGLECDKLSKEAADAHFAGLMGKLVADVGPLAGKTLVATHIDSWEVNSQNWTPRFAEEFRRRRGYDLLRFLPVMTGRVMDSVEVSERFLWDLRQSISELVLENYAGHFRDLAHQHGLRLTIEAYTTCPVDEMAYAGRADEPMGEFWSWAKYGAAFSCTEMASAAHVYGKRIVGAEAFTAADGEKWLGHPGNIKDLGDWAFCEGINRFVFHRYALQPWTDVKPGVSMGPWGLHYERTQTWWEQSRAWHEYLARCQFLLQQGLFVADLCLLSPEGSPQTLSGQHSFMSQSPGNGGRPLERPGYNFDTCPPEVVLTRMSVKNGRLVLPDGMSYRLLVLPQAETMTPQLLRKIAGLVKAGATVVGARPLKSPSLSDYPKCDQQVAKLANELWGADETPAVLTARPYGKGRVIRGTELDKNRNSTPEAGRLGSAKWIWQKEGNPAVAAPVGTRYFRRIVDVEAGSQIESARLVMTADNSFECWINGRRAGSGDNFARTYVMNVASLLKSGANLIAVAAENARDAPNPAGLIGSLTIKYRDGRALEVYTDRTWESAAAVQGEWTSAAAAGNWAAALELGPLGMQPWGNVEQTVASPDLFPDIGLICGLLEKMGVPPDFAYRAKNSSLRYIHRNIRGTDVYFVANKNPQPEQAVCFFRVRGKRPELWWPDTGRIERAAVYEAADGGVRVPIRFEQRGSVFVVFREAAAAERNRITSVTRDGAEILSTVWPPDRKLADYNNAATPNDTTIAVWMKPGADTAVEALVWQPGTYALKTASGEGRPFAVAALPQPMEIPGPWELSFAPGAGAPERVTLNRLISWSEHNDAGVKYFSGTATYRTTFVVNPKSEIRNPKFRTFLDLGKVQVIAEVKVNGQDLGILWKSPFGVEITDAVKSGENALEVKVVNLWVNRLIGDEQLPEDSARNPNGTLKEWPQWLQEGRSSPAGRYTFTSWRLWKKDAPLQESGLLGPVTLRTAALVTVQKP